MKLKHELESIHVGHSTVLLPQQNLEEKKNIFVGIGLWSKANGLTAGLPIDVLAMLIRADKLRRQLAANTDNIYIYVADNLALESNRDQPNISENAIIEQRDKTIELIRDICQWLHISDIFIEDSRVLSNSLSYQEILQELDSKQKTLALQDVILGETTENYVLKQTALLGFYQRERSCAVKISWCYDEKEIGNDPQQIIFNGIKNKNYDELWFDAYYQLLLSERYPIGFVYTQCGRALNISTNNASAPYFAKDPKKYPRVLFGDSIEVLQTKIPSKLTTGPSIKKGTIRSENSSPQVKYLLPPKFKKLMLEILQDLKESYGEYIQIKSRAGESNPIIIIDDLAKIANFRRLTAEQTIENNYTLQCELEADKLDSLPNQFTFFEKSNRGNLQNRLTEEKQFLQPYAVGNTLEYSY